MAFFATNRVRKSEQNSTGVLPTNNFFSLGRQHKLNIFMNGIVFVKQITCLIFSHSDIFPSAFQRRGSCARTVLTRRVWSKWCPRLPMAPNRRPRSTGRHAIFPCLRKPSTKLTEDFRRGFGTGSSVVILIREIGTQSAHEWYIFV